VNLITESDYRDDVDRVVKILNGKESEISDHFAEAMDLASENLDFEAAALYRDRILAIRRLQERQYI
jgi:excinuclease ABC subunit C